jgi:hypothetical protein
LIGNELFGRIGSVSVLKKGAVQAREFRGLRFAFNITKTSEANPNTGIVSVYNVSAENRTLFEEPKSQIIVKAGYSGFGVNPVEPQSVLGKDLAEIIYIGDIRLNGIKTQRQGPDVVTQLECSTGIVPLEGAKLNKSYAQGTTALQVITELASSMGLNISPFQTAGAHVFLGGLALSGSSRDLLTGILKKLGVQWSIQDDELHIVDKTLPTAEPLVLLTEFTGLIGIPTKMTNGGYIFKSLLNPKIRPGRSLSVVSEAITGIFKPRKVTHQGDLNGGAWETTVEAIGIG